MNPKSKVTFGNNPVEILGIADKLATKHKELGASSPLNTLTDVNWADFSKNVLLAADLQREVEELRLELETKCRKRDILIEPMGEDIRRAKNLLKTVYSKNPKLLGTWGFDVLYSTPGKSTKSDSKKDGKNENI